MGNYKEIKGDLIQLALEGNFDVIAHGCNCFCVMGAGIAPQMAKAFGCSDPEKYQQEDPEYRGNINKLGGIESRLYVHDINTDKEYVSKEDSDIDHLIMFTVINAYTQYGPGYSHVKGEIPLSYTALAMVLEKINHVFKGRRIGLPRIGCGLAGGSWEIVERMIKFLLKDCDVTVVNYDPK